MRRRLNADLRRGRRSKTKPIERKSEAQRWASPLDLEAVGSQLLHSFGEAFVDQHLHVDALIQGAAFGVGIAGGRVRGTVAGRRQDAAHRNTLFVAKILHHGGGALGWSGGAAVGAKLAQPSRTVVSLVGDGSFFLAPTVLKGRTALRVSITNFRTREEDLLALLEEAARIGGSILSGT